jgi:hypothetical protein
MIGGDLFLWVRVALIFGLGGYLLYSLWRRAIHTDFRLRRFTRKGYQTVRHQEEQDALQSLSKAIRLRIEGATEIARQRALERQEDAAKQKVEKIAAADLEPSLSSSGHRLKNTGGTRQTEEPAAEFVDEHESVSDPDSSSYWDSPPGVSGPSSLGPPVDSADQLESPDPEDQEKPKFTPDLATLGPKRKSTLGPPAHIAGRKLRLRLRNLDLDRLEIVANGRPVAEFEGEREKEVLVPIGTLLLEVMQLGGDGYCRGRINTETTQILSVSIADSQLVNCMADGQLWPIDIEARKSASVDRDAKDGMTGFKPLGDRPVPPWEQKGWDVSTGWDLSHGQDRVGLRIRSLDGEWADIYVNGAMLARIRSQEETEAFVPQGKHLLEVREYLADEPYCRAELVTGDTPEILIDVEQDQPIRSFYHESFRLLDT